MKKLIIFLLTLSISLEAYANYKTVGGKRVWVDSAEAKVTLRVVDEGGLPVANATVNASLFNSNYKDYRKPYNGHSDTNGCFSIDGNTTSDLRYTVVKNGYYSTTGRYSFREIAPEGEKAVIDKRWQPWNPEILVVMKPRIDPTSLYAKNETIRLDKDGTEVGYDLLLGDLVYPLGLGVTTDLLFSLIYEKEPGGAFNARLTVITPNPFDGIQICETSPKYGSKLKLPHKAPVEGYQRLYIKKTGKTARGVYYGFESPEVSSNNFFFKARSQANSDGIITNALFGKIIGPFNISRLSRNDTRISFKYYVNPTPNDRNLEFDPAKNLFKDLSWEEEVHEP